MSNTILDKIIAAKRRRIEASMRTTDIVELSKTAFDRRRSATPNRLVSALRSANTVNIISEIKRASPSKGVINDSLNIADVAIAYQRGGAAAISVLTEEDYFRGSIADLKLVRSNVGLPILQKDFFVEDFQVIESAATGADAILLIVGALSIDALRRLQKLANDLGLDAVVEVHDRGELDVALEIDAKIIGVNNRDLRSFEVSLDTSRDLAAAAPKGPLLISESGISTKEQIAELRYLGYSGFLIGESLMRSRDPKAKLHELTAIETDVFECNTTQ